MKAPAFYSPSHRSFTLVEMLAAIAVLAILMVILGTILGSTSKMADTSGRTNDSALEARQVLDHIGVDFSSMLIRPDMDQLTFKTTGNDQLFFYSQQTGYFDSSVATTQQSPMSLIGYRISSSANSSVPPALQRLAQGLTWEGTTSAMNYLTFSARTSVTNTPTVNSTTQIANQWTSMVNDPDTSETYWHEVGSQVFRFEVCYQLQNGSFTTNCPTYLNSGSITNTVAVVVAIAVLDSKSRKLVPSGSWTTLIAALKDPSPADLANSPPVMMDATWNNALQSTTFPATAGISTMAASHIKVYQRYYYLNAPKFQ